ncbi:MAG TPA: hypothetical protein EYO84_06260 [Planctomycetes bacterium]|nr:hypothetical protein [Planctomycetota bacterium]
MRYKYDVPDALNKRTSTMAIDELARRGHRTVRVLDRAAIFSLIDEAVENVVAERLSEINDKDCTKIRDEARSEFTRLVKERNSEQQEQQDNYEQRIAKLRDQAVDLEERLEDARLHKGASAHHLDPDELRSVVKEALEDSRSEPTEATGATGAQIDGIRKSIDALAAKVVHGSTGATARVQEVPSEEALVALFSKPSGEELENNLEQIEVKNAKAGGIAANLAKLRGLQKETE